MKYFYVVIHFMLWKSVHKWVHHNLLRVWSLLLDDEWYQDDDDEWWYLLNHVVSWYYDHRCDVFFYRFDCGVSWPGYINYSHLIFSVYGSCLLWTFCTDPWRLSLPVRICNSCWSFSVFCNMPSRIWTKRSWLFCIVFLYIFKQYKNPILPRLRTHHSLFLPKSLNTRNEFPIQILAYLFPNLVLFPLFVHILHENDIG